MYDFSSYLKKYEKKYALQEGKFFIKPNKNIDQVF